MQIPTIRGVIDRRILVNFRVDPEVLTAVCPAPFRPQLIGGFGIAGICLIRLKQIRPKWMPAFVGIHSENAAHRIAVQWDEFGQVRTGVFIPRRDSSSWLNAILGGRIFPGVHRFAKFIVDEKDDQYRIEMTAARDQSNVVVEGCVANELPEDSIFGSVEECSEFFKAGSIGYSPANSPSQFDGLELRTDRWQVEPLSITKVYSSFFEDRNAFPVGSVTFDNALLMTSIEHEWHGHGSICCGENQ